MLDLLRYILRKLIMVLPLLWGVITLIFVLVELSPGTVVDKFINQETTPEVRDMLIAKWHLDQPAWERYFYMMRNLVVLDFGMSMDRNEPVFDVIALYLPNTLKLSLVTMATSYPIGLMLGTIQAVFQGRKNFTAVDTTISVGSLFFYSMPSFWLALMLQLVFSHALIPYGVQFPSSGMHDTVMYAYMAPSEQRWDQLTHIVLPGVAMGLAYSAGVARYMRSSLLEVIRQDYVRTARAKGLPEVRVVLVHAFRNALLPIITLFGLSLPGLFGGSVLVESVFAWPGMGRCILQAIQSQDTPLIIACFFVYTLIVATGSLIADLAYAFADPRIRYDG
jgi:peptide/nickel transport system permease protein